MGGLRRGGGVLLTFEGSRFRLLAARHPKSKQLKLFQFSPVRNYTSSWPRAPRAAAPRALRSASLSPSLRAPLLAPAPARARARGSLLPGAPRSARWLTPNFPSLRPPPPTSKRKKREGKKKKKEKAGKPFLKNYNTVLEEASDTPKSKNPLLFPPQ